MANVINVLYATPDPCFWTGSNFKHQCRLGLELSSDRYASIYTAISSLATCRTGALGQLLLLGR